MLKLKRPATLRGNIDLISEAVAVGWVMHRTNRAKRLGVEVRLRGRIVASGQADRFRPDLLASGLGDGRYGFTIDLPPGLAKQDLPLLRVVEVETGRPFAQYVAPLAPAGVDDTPAQWNELFDAEHSTLRGNIDLISEAVAVGWVMHRTDRAKRLGVEVRLGGRIVASGQADRFRPDLLASGLGDGRYGFTIDLPPGLAKQDLPLLRVVEVETGRPFAQYVAPLAPAGVDDTPAQWNELFDAEHYAWQLMQAKIEPSHKRPEEHYRSEGWKLGLNPHPLFDTNFYLAQLAERPSTDPITHFLKIGQDALLSPHPLCDVEFYYTNRPDVREARIHPLWHYLGNAGKEDLRLTPLFDERAYRKTIEEDGISDPLLLHYLKFGWREGLRPHASFEPLLYRRLMKLESHVEPYSRFLGLISQSRIAPSPQRNPKYSIIVLNLNKTMLTLQCIAFVNQFTSCEDYEIIVVDNGSNWDEFSLLCRFGTGVRIIRLDHNMGFGEGNNVGVDAAQGEYLIFLNNDAFVTQGWLPPLVDALDADPKAGAAGPKFLYPDGRLQEAGGLLSSCGTPVQRGKGLDADDPLFNTPQVVDYCSAATLLMRAASFRRVLGYDLCFDPAYYEDADLCLKLRLIDQRVLYVPNSTVIHIEHATAADQTTGVRMEGIAHINRVKFVARWGRYLANQSDGTREAQLIPAPPSPAPVTGQPSITKRLALYTPYPLTPGGGERYLLSLAAVLRTDYDCTLFTYDHYSRIRLATLARELDLPLDHLTIQPWKRATQAEKFDVFICMSNEILPGVPPIGRLNLFLCQFPFPMQPGGYARDWGNLSGYDATIVYSRFVASHAAAAADRLGLTLPPCHVLAPPVPQVTSAGLPAGASAPYRIVNVGRFTPSGHCKRQDVMIEAFRDLVATAGTPVELHLAGALGSHALDREYLVSLQRAARGLPVFFHLNATPEQIHDLYRGASVYWHMTGANDDVRQKPERFEHFGITIGEAMSAGAIPISLRHGGPGEIITDGVNGFLVSNRTELHDRTIRLIEGGDGTIGTLRAAARRRAADFAIDRLEARLRAVIASPHAPRQQSL